MPASFFRLFKPNKNQSNIDLKERKVHPLSNILYRGRIVEYLITLILAASISYKEANYYLWAYIIGFAFIWPHIAYYIAKNSKNTFKSEKINLCFDSIFIGTLINIVSLSLWPSTFFLVAASTITVLFGGIKFGIQSILLATLGYFASGLFIKLEFLWEASLLTTAFSAAALFINGLLLSQFAYKTIKAHSKLRKEIKYQKSQIEGLAGKLAKYLSPQVYGSIFSGEKDVKIETNRKKLTVFFSDIKDFTSITDSMESEGLTSLLNNYFNEMTKIALRYGGTIDKFIGDAIMIFFGDPESKGEKEDAISCVLMAIEMRDKMNELQKHWGELGISRPLKIRMGINSGFCTVGNFGSEDRMDYTIIGKQVNLASRLESHAASDQILISKETYALIKDKIACERKEEITAKGVPYPVQTYQVIDLHEKVKEFENQINANYQGFSLKVNLNETNCEQTSKWLKEALKKVELIQEK